MPRTLPRLAAAGLALLASAAIAQAPPLWEPPLPKATDPATRTFAGGVRLYGDITYSALPDYRPLKLDLYLPAKADTPRPLVVWIHGGGWSIGNPRADWTYGDWAEVLARLSARGYAVAAITYRFKGEARFPAQIDDVRASLRFLRAHAAAWTIDPSRVYLWGLSAGGHLAALAAMQSATQPADTQVQGLVEWFGPNDLAAAYDGKPGNLSGLLGCPQSGCTKAALDAASPVTYVTSKAPPSLIMQGEADPLVKPEQARILHDRLTAAGAQSELVMLPGLSHGFVGASPAKLDDLLQQTFGFFDRLSAKAR